MSKFLRRWQLTGKVADEKVPDNDDAMLPFWAGWLTAAGRNNQATFNFDQAREMAIKAAEFIETRKGES